MTSQTNEAALEATIQKHLTGTCLEELKEQNVSFHTVAYQNRNQQLERSTKISVA